MKALVPIVGLIASAIGLVVAPLAAQAGSWLDSPPAAWNTGVVTVPAAPPAQAGLAAAVKKCALAAPPATPATAAVSKAGWLPFLHLDRTLMRGDIEVVAGLTGVTPICAPTGFNLFVFVSGRFAGSLSPVAMTTNQDGAPGAVRLATDDSILVEYARYAAGDTECCPSSRVRVTYRIDRGPTPTVQATGVEKLR